MLLLPLHLAKLWLMGALNLVLSLFHLLGMMPSEYANRVKVHATPQSCCTLRQPTPRDHPAADFVCSASMSCPSNTRVLPFRKHAPSRSSAQISS